MLGIPMKQTAAELSSASQDPEIEPDLMLAEGAESEEDLQDLDPSILGQAVVFATDWTADTVIGQLRKGNITLDPTFQRRDAWTAQRKSRFIESIILGLPIPQIVLAENRDQKGAFIVIDGKQRLLSLQQFAGINLEGNATPLKLSGLIMRRNAELNGKTYADLNNDSRFHRYLTAFDNQPIRTVIVRNWQKEEVLYLIFHRLNTSSVPLSPQELRQALLRGPFLAYAAQYSETSKGLRRALGLSKPDFRMRDVELLVRYFAFRNRLPLYSGNLKEFLDDTCKEFNRKWAERKQELQFEAQEFEGAVDTAFKIFDGHAFRKWDGAKYEQRFNRAVFDVIVYYFSDEAVRKQAVIRKGKVKSAFQLLCEEDGNFRNSIETTTKSKGATSTRFRSWGIKLGKTLGMKLDIPPVLAQN